MQSIPPITTSTYLMSAFVAREAKRIGEWTKDALAAFATSVDY